MSPAKRDSETRTAMLGREEETFFSMVKQTLCNADAMEGGGKAPLIFNVASRWRGAVSYTCTH
jgi:hypothetical protein